MKTFTCPHCGSKSISLKQKFLLGSAGTSSCGQCGAWLSTPLVWRIVTISPLIMWLLLTRFGVISKEESHQWLALGVVFVLMIMLDVFVVPVVEKWPEKSAR